MNRRKFVQSVIGIAAFLLAGCSFDSIETDIENYVPFLLQAVAGIVMLFDPPLGATLGTVIILVNAGLAALVKAVADWKAADATQKPGLVGDVIATLETVQTDLGTFLAAIKENASGPIYTAALALTTIVLGVLQYFINKLTPVASTKARVLMAGSEQLQIEPLHYSSKQFRAAFNAKAVALGYPQSQIK
jgi:hypothetical protein